MKCPDCGDVIDVRQRRLHKAGGQCQAIQQARKTQHLNYYDDFKAKTFTLARRLVIDADVAGVANDIAGAETPAMAAVVAIEVVRLAADHDPTLNGKHYDLINALLMRARVLHG